MEAAQCLVLTTFLWVNDVGCGRPAFAGYAAASILYNTLRGTEKASYSLCFLNMMCFGVLILPNAYALFWVVLTCLGWILFLGGER